MTELKKTAPLKSFGLCLSAFLAIAILVTIASGQSDTVIFNPPYLLLTLSLIFWSATTVAITYISAKSFLKEGTPAVLLLAGAVLIFGLSNIVSSAVQQVSGNYSVIIGNSCFVVSSILQVVAAIAVSTNFLEGRLVFNRKVQIAVAYVGSILLVFFFSVLAFGGLLPPFFTASGPTLLRQTVLGTSVVLLAVAFLVFARQYFRSKSPGLFWYCLAVGLMSLGLFSAFETRQLGDLVTWFARATLYTASFFLLAAVLQPRFGIGMTDMANGWANAFRSDRRQIAFFFSKLSEGFAYCKLVGDEYEKSPDFVYLDINEAFEKMIGKTRVNVVGRKNSEVLPDMGSDPESQTVLRLYAKVALTGESKRFERYSKFVDKWFNILVYSPNKGYFAVLLEEITERKKAEESLRSTEKLLSSVTNGSSDAIYVKDRQSRWLFANPALERIVGKPSAEVLGKNDFEIYSNTEVSKAIMENDRRIMDSGQPATFEESVEYPDGPHSFISVKAPRFDDKGQVIGLVGISHDITGRKKKEEAIRRQASLIDLSPDAIIARTIEGTITFWSKGAENMYGWTTKEAIGQTTHTLLKTRFPEPLNKINSQVETLGHWSGELVHETKDGRVLIVQSWWLAEKDEQSKIKGVFESNNDVTERKKTEEKLRESKVWEATSLYTRNLIEASLDPLVTISADGKITDVNKATEHITGHPREELIGSDFSNYFTEPEKAAAGYKQAFTEGSVKDYPLAIRHKSGKITEVLYNASVYLDPAGNVQGVFAAARDITERKNLERQLQEKERLAAIGATAGMVGHDIRNPLQGITSDVYLLRSELSELPEGKVRENMNESLEGIDQNVQYVNKIVQDLQDYARPINPSRKEINLEALCEFVLFKNGVSENTEASCQVEKKAKKITTDPELLKRVLSNLVTNAVQATPKGGKITLHAYKEAEYTVITVQDTGEGIPEEVRPKLFTPLFTTKSKGQGFGLAVVKRIVEALDGTVTFESEPGKGTTFIIRLPPQKI